MIPKVLQNSGVLSKAYNVSTADTAKVLSSNSIYPLDILTSMSSLSENPFLLIIFSELQIWSLSLNCIYHSFPSGYDQQACVSTPNRIHYNRISGHYSHYHSSNSKRTTLPTHKALACINSPYPLVSTTVMPRNLPRQITQIPLILIPSFQLQSTTPSHP